MLRNLSAEFICGCCGKIVEVGDILYNILKDEIPVNTEIEVFKENSTSGSTLPQFAVSEPDSMLYSVISTV